MKAIWKQLQINLEIIRLGAAAAEMEYGETPGNFDIIIINDQLDTAYLDLRNFILPEIEKLTRYMTPREFPIKTVRYALDEMHLLINLFACYYRVWFVSCWMHIPLTFCKYNFYKSKLCIIQQI